MVSFVTSFLRERCGVKIRNFVENCGKAVFHFRTGLSRVLLHVVHRPGDETAAGVIDSLRSRTQTEFCVSGHWRRQSNPSHNHQQ